MNGLAKIASAFSSARAQGRAALMPYYTFGFPDPSLSLAVFEAIASSGADLIELGVPFSDPLADGPTIQRSTQIALKQGITLARCLEMTVELRRRGIKQPLLMMGYANPILAYGVTRFVAAAAQAGVDGLIIPDLPPEESGEIEAVCQTQEIAQVFLAAPTSTPERLALVAGHTRGFLYLVSVTGVTGVRHALPPDLAGFIQRARACTHTPVAVGFGVSTPAQARFVGSQADGVIIGSALIDRVGASANPPAAASAFIEEMLLALIPD